MVESNGTQSKATPEALVKELTGPPKTKDYRPSYVPGLDWNYGMLGPWHNRWVEQMRLDPQVSLCLEYRKATIHTAEFEYDANSPEVQQYVQEQTMHFWRKDLEIALESLVFGYCGAEAMYKCEGGYVKHAYLKPLHPNDVRVWTRCGKLHHVRVQSVSNMYAPDLPYYDYPAKPGEKEDPDAIGHVRLEASHDGRPPKGVWFVHDNMYSQWYGRSILSPAWLPWRWKTMPDGANDVIAKWYYRHAYSGMLVRHPDTTYEESDGGPEVPAKETARQMGTQTKTGANLTLPSARDEHGQYLWDIAQYAKIEGSGKDLLDYVNSYLDIQIQRGIGIPDELITHQGNTGGYSRSQVSLTAYLIFSQLVVHQILESWVDQSLRPLVCLNFGRHARFAIRPKALLPPEQGAAPGASPGGPPGAPLPPPPGAGQAGLPPPPPPGGGAQPPAPAPAQGANPLAGLFGPPSGTQMSYGTIRMDWLPFRTKKGTTGAYDSGNPGEKLYGADAEKALHQLYHEARGTPQPTFHAPRGGAVISGRRFNPGEQIPDDVLSAIPLKKRSLLTQRTGQPVTFSEVAKQMGGSAAKAGMHALHSLSGIYHKGKRIVTGNETLKHAAKRAAQKTLVKYKRLEARYGRPAALAMAGAYLGSWVLWGVNPVLGAMIAPEPMCQLIGIAEGIRKAKQLLAPTAVKLSWVPFTSEAGHLGAYRSDKPEEKLYGDDAERALRSQNDQSVEDVRKQLRDRFNPPRKSYNPKTHPQTEAEIEAVAQTKRAGETAVDAWLQDALQYHTITEEQGKEYADNLKAVMRNMTAPMIERIIKNVTHATFFGSVANLTAVTAGNEWMIKHPGEMVGGAWEWSTEIGSGKSGDEIRDKGSLYLDGGSETNLGFGLTAKHIYAHELGHAIDGWNFYSNTFEWYSCWSGEIDRDDNPLSRYARTNQQEGWAEFIRLHTLAPKAARLMFPRCFAFCRERGLV